MNTYKKTCRGQVKDKINEGITQLINLECSLDKFIDTQITKDLVIKISVGIFWKVETEILDNVRDHLRAYFERTLNHKERR